MGSLLLAFLPTSLQEQISSRKYFYKSGRLIKDGIITLSNTDFSRDIMDQVCLCAILLLPPCYVVTLELWAMPHTYCLVNVSSFASTGHQPVVPKRLNSCLNQNVLCAVLLVPPLCAATVKLRPVLQILPALLVRACVRACIWVWGGGGWEGEGLCQPMASMRRGNVDARRRGEGSRCSHLFMLYWIAVLRASLSADAC